jgi:hypothetical protein
MHALQARTSKGGFGDEGAYTLGKVNKQANLYMKERGLPERLNYGDSDTPIFYGNASTTNSGMIRKMVKGTLNPLLALVAITKPAGALSPQLALAYSECAYAQLTQTLSCARLQRRL